MTKYQYLSLLEINDDYTIVWQYFLEVTKGAFKISKDELIAKIYKTCADNSTTPLFLFMKIRQYYEKQFNIARLYSDSKMEELLIVGNEEDFLITEPDNYDGIYELE